MNARYFSSLAPVVAATLVFGMKPSLSAAERLSTQSFEWQPRAAVKLQYLLHLPDGYDAAGAKKWPLLLFLHGAGERGTDVNRVAIHGPLKLARQGTNFPFIIVAPQCPAGQRWQNEPLLALLDDVIARHAVDTNRVYLSGLSMGGFGSWSLAAQQPQRFAAVAPVCGGGQTIDVLLGAGDRGAALKRLPIWAFHGAKDPVVALEESERMVAAFKKIGNPNVKLTVYPEAQHDSWTETYANAGFYEWLLKQSLPGGKAD